MNRDTFPLHTHLQRLITLLYGLALATGLEYAVPRTFESCASQMLAYVPLVSAAFLIGLSDWAVYHRFASTHCYPNLWRVVMDILFPVLVYVLFVAAGDTERFLIVLVVYSALSFVYVLFLAAEQIAVERSLTEQYRLTCLGSLLLLLLDRDLGILEWRYLQIVLALVILFSWGPISACPAARQLLLEWRRWRSSASGDPDK